jgi:hypothetical protein
LRTVQLHPDPISVIYNLIHEFGPDLERKFR